MKKNLSQKLKLLLTLFVLMAAVISASAGKSTTLAVIGDSYSTFNTDTSNLEDTDYYYPYWSKQNGNDVSDISETWREVLADKINGEDILPNNEYRMSGNKISVKTLDLTGYFKNIEDRLDSIVRDHFGDVVKKQR